jgi:uncharacterized membrane protein YphA (DoxX/SURF4 family)
MMKPYFLMVLRLMVGGVFIWTGFQKLILHFENFLYVVQAYEIFGKDSREFLYIAVFNVSLGEMLEVMAAWTLPWIEFLAGVFLVVGLWIRRSAWTVGVLTLIFAMATGQALLRGLPIDECGCFGEGLTLPLRVTFLTDIGLLILIAILGKFSRMSDLLSFDRYFAGTCPETAHASEKVKNPPANEADQTGFK